MRDSLESFIPLQLHTQPDVWHNLTTGAKRSLLTALLGMISAGREHLAADRGGVILMVRSLTSSGITSTPHKFQGTKDLLRAVKRIQLLSLMTSTNPAGISGMWKNCRLNY